MLLSMRRHVDSMARRRTLRRSQNHVSRSRQVLNETLGGDPCHHFVGLVRPFSSKVPERKGERLDDFIRVGEAQFRFIGHNRH